MCKFSKKRRIRRIQRFFRQRKRAYANAHWLRGRGCRAQNIKTSRRLSHTHTGARARVHLHTDRTRANVTGVCSEGGVGGCQGAQSISSMAASTCTLYLPACTLSYTIPIHLLNNDERYSH